MDLDAMRAHIRRLARTQSSSHSDTVLKDYVNEAQREWTREVGDEHVSEDYINITPTFDLRTDYYIQVTVAGTGETCTDEEIAVCASDADDQTGAQVATALQTALKTISGISKASVSFNNDQEFEINVTDATSITIEAPSTAHYKNGRSLLLGSVDDTQTVSASAPWTSASANSLTDTPDLPFVVMDGDLPSDFGSIVSVDWDGIRLTNSTKDLFNDQQQKGSPTEFGILDDKIRINPVPTDVDDKVIHINYFQVHSDLSAGGDTSTVATAYHMAICYYVAFMCAEDNRDPRLSQTLFARWRKSLEQYRCNLANRNARLEYIDEYAVDPALERFGSYMDID